MKSGNLTFYRARTVAVYFLIVAALFSCNKGGKDSETKSVSSSGNSIEVELWASSPVDTSVKLFFIGEGEEQFGDSRAISKPIAGSGKLQKIVFKLPDTLKAPQLRLDFQAAAPVTLKRFIVRYGNRNLDAYGTEVFRYFRPDLNKCRVDLETGVITPVSKDGKLSAPSLYPHKAFFLHKMKGLTQ